MTITWGLTADLTTTGGVAAIAHLRAHPTNHRTIHAVAGRNRLQLTETSQARMPEPLHLEGEEP
jgi:hypothetical protein